ncbi:hypothetical protein [Niabella ginsenosidivorans]|uniref:hypothetical protein n=1 Tax=Niabella ginsenosidivorans TaxID=1176587 RepID=UPI00373FE016
MKDVNAKAIFYELDLPEVIALLKQLLPSAANDLYLPHSMFETGRGWLLKLIPTFKYRGRILSYRGSR